MRNSHTQRSDFIGVKVATKWRIGIALVMAFGASTSFGACELGPGLEIREFDNYQCLQLARLQLVRGEGAAACITQLLKDATTSMEKAKACYKKQKNPEGLRAFGEYWAVYREAVNGSGSPNVSSGAFDALIAEARRKRSTLEAVD
jgi:hypothetical protein